MQKIMIASLFARAGSKLLLLGGVLFVGLHCLAPAVAAQSGTLAVTSAASYQLTIAPESIAAGFGSQLSNSTQVGVDTDAGTPGIQLPTTLGGTTVDIAGRAASIFFVSPTQVNFLVPADVPNGTATVNIRNGAITRTGTVTVAQAAPSLFTFNANGEGVVAGVTLRIRNSQSIYESLADFNGSTWVTRPIDLGPNTDQVYLVLYGTGLRRIAASVRVLLGGDTLTPTFAGAQPDLLGLDQINVLIPRSNLGIGRLSVLAGTNSVQPLNDAEVEIGGVTSSNSPVVNVVSPSVTQAAQTITINGSGFSGNVNGNLVRIGGVDAQVVSASASQIVATVPYGSESGKVMVRTNNGDGLSAGDLKIRTSLSGVVESTDRQPLNNVTVKSLTAGLKLISTKSSTNGAFVLTEFTDPASGSAFVTIDGSGVNTTPKFGTLTVNQNFLSGKDTQFANPLTLQQITGSSAQVGGALQGTAHGEPITLSQPIYAPADEDNALRGEAAAPNASIKVGDVTFELPNDAPVRFPDGTTSGRITLTVVEGARLPVRYPAGLHSSAVVQITPFGTTFGKGGRLRFPNTDRYPANAKLFICVYDQDGKSNTLGQWQAPGGATVTSDGLFIDTDPGTITQGSFYFVVGVRQTTTAAGRVIDADKSPVRRALVRLRGQEALTDGNGFFLLRDVPVTNADDVLIAEASFLRPSGRVDRANSNRTFPNINGITNLGLITLPDQRLNQAPILIVAPTLTTEADKRTDYEFIAYDYDDASIPKLSVTGVTFATIVPGTATTPTILRLSPTQKEIGVNNRLVITATDSQGTNTVRTVTVTVVAPGGTFLTDEFVNKRKTPQ